MTDRPTTADLLAFVHELADAARPIALKHFRTPLDIVSKADKSPVTIADRNDRDRAARRRIEARFPGHGIFGEEMGGRRATGGPG